MKRQKIKGRKKSATARRMRRKTLAANKTLAKTATDFKPHLDLSKPENVMLLQHLQKNSTLVKKIMLHSLPPKSSVVAVCFAFLIAFGAIGGEIVKPYFLSVSAAPIVGDEYLSMFQVQSFSDPREQRPKVNNSLALNDPPPSITKFIASYINFTKPELIKENTGLKKLLVQVASSIFGRQPLAVDIPIANPQTPGAIGQVLGKSVLLKHLSSYKGGKLPAQ